MHNPIFNNNNRMSIDDEFLKETFNDSYEMTRNRNVARMEFEDYKSDIKIDNLSMFNADLISIYIQWLRTFDEYNNNNNIETFITELTKVINSDMFNLQIIHEVYNPILKTKRYKVINAENEEILIDDIISNMDESLLYCGLFPPEFIHAIGLQWKLRENNIKTLLK